MAAQNVHHLQAVQGDNDSRPVLRVEAGRMAELTEQADSVLAGRAANDSPPLFRFGETLVRVTNVPTDDAIERDAGTVGLAQVTQPLLRHTLDRLIRFEKYNGSSRKYLPTDCPGELVKRMMARLPESNIPRLTGLVNAPTLRDDGTPIDTPGWDEETGIFYQPNEDGFLPAPPEPTRDDALEALNELLDPLRDVPFKADADRSAIVAAVLTALIRPSLPNAPMFGISANAAGSGKGQLAKYVSILATGHAPSIIGQGEKEEELEKRIDAALLAGDPVVAIDNVERPLRSDKLCMLLTEESPRVRILGQSDIRRVPNKSTWIATGNALTPEGDMTRRTILCRLEPQMERPDERQFEQSIEEIASDRRPENPSSARSVCRVVGYLRVARN